MSGGLESQLSVAFCDPTSIPKLPRLVSALIPLIPESPKELRPLTHIAPNLLELDLLYTSFTSDTLSEEISDRSWKYINSLNLDAAFRAKVETFTNDKLWIRNQGVVQKTISCLPFIDSFWIKCGSLGLVVVSKTPEPFNLTGGDWSGVNHKLSQGYLSIVHFPAGLVNPEEIVSTTGAGDTLSGGLVAGLIDRQTDLRWVRTAMDRAEKSIKSRRAVG